MAEGPLQILPLLLAAPAQPPQFQIQARQFAAPVFRICGGGGRRGRWGCRRGGGGAGPDMGFVMGKAAEEDDGPRDITQVTIPKDLAGAIIGMIMD